MFSSRTADGDGEIMFAFRLILGKKWGKHGLKIGHKLSECGVVVYIGPDSFVFAIFFAELFVPVWIL